MQSEKADYDDSLYVTEHKHTRRRSYYLSEGTWATILRHAKAVGKKPRIVVCFRPVAGIEFWWQVIPRDTTPRFLRKGFIIRADTGSSKPCRRVIVEQLSSS